MSIGSDPLRPPEAPDAAQREVVRFMVSEPQNLFVSHTKEFEFFSGTYAKLLRIASEAGFQQLAVHKISDRYGREVYEVYRFGRRDPHLVLIPTLSTTIPNSR